jgi:predicted DNA-binding transcriptional regulator AlpA
MTEKRYAIAPEVAERYRTSRAQVYQWTREHKFPSQCILRIGKKILWDLEVLDAWAAAGGSPTLDQATGTDR